MPESLRIAYLVEDTALSGGVRVQLAQADALVARGHRVRLVTKGLPAHVAHIARRVGLRR